MARQPARSQPLLPSSYGSYDANSLAYNASTGTFVVASITTQNSQDTIGGAADLELPACRRRAMRFVEAPAGTGSRRYPRAAASNTDGRFMVVFNKSQSAFFGQLLATGAGGGSPPPPRRHRHRLPRHRPLRRRSRPRKPTSAGIPSRICSGATTTALSPSGQMNGLSAAQSSYLGPGPVDLAWQIAGTGDLNGDGKPEIIWRHSAGWLYAWFMNGTALQSGRVSHAEPHRHEPVEDRRRRRHERRRARRT